MKKPSNPILIATLGAPHGIKGEVRVKSFTDNPMALGDYGPLFDTSGTAYSVRNARPSKSILVVQFEGVNTREAAEALRNRELFVDRSALPDIEEEDEYYLSDLIGMTVINTEGETIGRIKDVPNFGADDMLEIQPAKGDGFGGHTYFLPFTKRTVPDIDFDKGFVTVDPPEEIVVQEKSQ